MANTQIIQKFLPQPLRDSAAQYSIPDQFIEKKADLVAMLVQSRAIEKPEEKQGWFDLLPLMNDEQIAKLEDILVREKQKLDEIEKKYEDKKIDIKKKYLMKWQEMGYTKQVENINQQEAKSEAQEDKEADALLEQI